MVGCFCAVVYGGSWEGVFDEESRRASVQVTRNGSYPGYDV